METTLIHRFEFAREHFAQRPLLGVKIQNEFFWENYETVFARAQNAQRLFEFKKGDIVALISDNRPEWVYIMLAALYEGAALVPMYENARKEHCANHEQNPHRKNALFSSCKPQNCEKRQNYKRFAKCIRHHKKMVGKTAKTRHLSSWAQNIVDQFKNLH